MANYNEQLDYFNRQKIKNLEKELPQFLGVYFSDMLNSGKSSRTVLGYAQDLKLFFDYLQSAGFKDKNLRISTADILEKLTIHDINEYLEDTLSSKMVNGDIKNYSVNTRARRVSSIRAMYKFFYRQGFIENDLSNRLTSPKIKDKPIRALDTYDVNRVLNAVLDIDGMNGQQLEKHKKVEKRDYAILILLFGTGMRVSELVGLDENSIDYDKNSVRIRRKGGNIEDLYFGESVEDALIDYVRNGRDNLEPKEETALFISTAHKRITVRAVEKLIKKYALKSGIANPEEITPHKARSTYGTALYNASGDIQLVADSLGHSSIETTRKHYARTSDEHRRKAGATPLPLSQINLACKVYPNSSNICCVSIRYLSIVHTKIFDLSSASCKALL